MTVLVLLLALPSRARGADLPALEKEDDRAAVVVQRDEAELDRLQKAYVADRDRLDAARAALARAQLDGLLAAWKADGSVEVLSDVDAQALNGSFVAAGGSAPFSLDVPVRKLRVLKPIELCQGQAESDLRKGWYGSWFLPCAADRYFGERALRDLAALPDTNKLEYVARLRIPAGVQLIAGAAGAIRGEIRARVSKLYADGSGKAVGGGGHGGTVQFWLDAKSQGKQRACDFGITLVRMAPIPLSGDPKLLDASMAWRKAYGDEQASRAVYAAFKADRDARAGSSEPLGSDIRRFDSFFRESFSKEYPGAEPLD